MAHLGHRTPGLAYKHYVDPRLLEQDRPAPPVLKFNIPQATTSPMTEPAYRKARPVEGLPPDCLADVMHRVVSAREIAVDDVRLVVDSLGLRHRDFAQRVGIDKSMLSLILVGKCRLTERVGKAVRREVAVMLRRLVDGEQEVQVPA